MKYGRVILSLGCGLVLSAFFSGCALNDQNVQLNYVPQKNVQHLTGAENVTVLVVISDQRNTKDITNGIVGYKKNISGVETTPIITDNDVPTLIRQAILTELTARGFQPGTNNAITVVVELTRFYNDFETGFRTGVAVAEADMNAVVKDANGAIVFSKLISGIGEKSKIQYAMNEYARIALEAALKNAVARLFNEPAFINALLAAGKR